ncbi:MAG: hypothetical protein V1760_02005 [Candidatus Peregrinibacteria bacterium]
MNFHQKLQETTEHTIAVRHKKYPYTIQRIDDGQILFTCAAAGICQKADIQTLFRILINLPEKILKTRQEKRPTSKKTIHFRVDDDDKEVIEKEAFERGYPSISSYIRALALGDTVKTRPHGFDRF